MTLTDTLFETLKTFIQDTQSIWARLLNRLENFEISIGDVENIRKCSEQLKYFDGSYTLDLAFVNEKTQDILVAAKSATKSITSHIDDSEIVDLLSRMINICQNQLNEISKYKIRFDQIKHLTPVDSHATPEHKRLESLQEHLKAFESELTTHKQNNFSLQVDSIAKLKKINDALNERLKPFISIMSEAKVYVDGKKNEIDNLLELTSGSVLAGSYSNHAKQERISSEIFRAIAICFMLGITSLIGYTLYESTTTEFDLKIAIYRLIFSLVLSVPTAYFAKEATKHRQQQHLYLQTYLDLVAIDPYVAKMDDRDKYRIKALVANRIFSKVNSSGESPESYPINVQQLVEKLIDSIDLKGKKEKTD